MSNLTGAELIAQERQEQIISFANWMAENVCGSYFINGEGRFELPEEMVLISAADLYNKYLQSCDNDEPIQRDCPNCQGGGCAVCGGSGYIIN